MKAVLALALLIAPIAAQGQPITRAEARGMTLPALAERYLGRPAAEFREVGFYNANWAFRGSDPVSIVFAEAPRFSGFAGICEARTLSIRFLPPRDAAAAGAPLTQQPAEEALRFRVIDGAPGGKARAGDIARQTRACAEGPVLPTGEWDDNGRFFPVFGMSAVNFDRFVRALRTAQDNARRHRHLPECRPDVMLAHDPMCVDPARALANVDWLRLKGVSFWERDRLSHATFFFKRDPREARRADMVQVEIDGYVHERQDDVQIESVRIFGVTAID
jgi:hypothetical protein